MNSYKTKGTCSREILFDIKDNVIQRVEFIGGSLVKGMKVDDAISKLKGIDCNGKGTSCPDQLAKALLQWKENNQSQFKKYQFPYIIQSFRRQAPSHAFTNKGTDILINKIGKLKQKNY